MHIKFHNIIMAKKLNEIHENLIPMKINNQYGINSYTQQWTQTYALQPTHLLSSFLFG